MKEEKIHEPKRKSFLARNGFFVALSFCLLAIGIATFTTINNLSQEKARINDSDVANNVTDVPATMERSKYLTTGAAEEMTVAATTAAPTSETTTESNTPRFVMPLDNSVINEFSKGELVYSKTMRDYRIHNGIDIEGVKGEDVRAFCDGKVSKIYTDELYGKTIIIDGPDGIKCYYYGVAPTESLNEGQEIKAGQIIGQVDSVTCENLEDSHIHLEVLKGDKFIDPQSLIEE